MAVDLSLCLDCVIFIRVTFYYIITQQPRQEKNVLIDFVECPALVSLLICELGESETNELSGRRREAGLMSLWCSER